MFLFLRIPCINAAIYIYIEYQLSTVGTRCNADGLLKNNSKNRNRICPNLKPENQICVPRFGNRFWYRQFESIPLNCPLIHYRGKSNILMFLHNDSDLDCKFSNRMF